MKRIYMKRDRSGSIVKPAIASRILRNVPEYAFRFAADIGDYTGDSAESLIDFREKVLTVPLKSVKFHLYPRPPDFQRWIRETLGDAQFAKQIAMIKKPRGERLRKTLLTLIDSRLDYLHSMKMTRVKGIGPKSSKKLVALGINSVADLAACDARDLAQNTGVSEKLTAKWIQNAQLA
jgi:hypothetical protein